MIEFSPTNPSAAQRDAKTTALLQGGDPEGLARLIADHGGRVFAMLRKEFGSVLGDAGIDDALSLASVRIWNAGPRFDAKRGTIRAWFAVIARNCALRLIEARRRQVEHSAADLDSRAGAAEVTPRSSSLDQQHLARDLHRCIDELPALQRAVALADLAAGGTAPAAALAASIGTTANSIYVSRLKYRRTIQRALGALGHALGGTALTPPVADGTTNIKTTDRHLEGSADGVSG